MSTLSVTNIKTANGTTDISMTTGNTASGAMVMYANGAGFIIQSNSSVTAFVANTTAVNLPVANNLNFSANGITFSDLTQLSSAANATTGPRNRIINGNMAVDQRNAGAAISAANLTTGSYTVDRWQYNSTQTAKFNAQQNQGSVTTPVGFPNYLGLTSQSAYSVTSTDFFSIRQPIEGFNAADWGWGTASAKTVTLSFLVYSSLTGTFGGSIYNYAGSRSYPFSYSVPSANTWTTISVTIAGDTSGTWTGNSSSGWGEIHFSLGAGSSVSGTAGSWSSTLYYSATSAVSVVGTSGATFYITGVQLEQGSAATSFERRPYGTELALCQRYFNTSFPIGTAPADNASTYLQTSSSAATTTQVSGAFFQFPISMRATPTITFYCGASLASSPTAGQWAYFSSTWTNGSSTTAGLDGAVGFCPKTNGTFTLNSSYTIAGNYTASAEL